MKYCGKYLSQVVFMSAAGFTARSEDNGMGEIPISEEGYMLPDASQDAS